MVNVHINPGAKENYCQPHCDCTDFKCYTFPRTMLDLLFTPIYMVGNMVSIFSPAATCKHSFAWYFYVALLSNNTFTVRNSMVSEDVYSLSINTRLPAGIYTLNTEYSCYPYTARTANIY